MSARTERSRFNSWPATFDNSLMRDLRAEPEERDPRESRQVLGAHYTKVRPTVEAPKPEMVIYSAAVAEQLGLEAADCEGEDFLRFFSGSPPKAVDCWATVYGASFTGQYGGQRGDGRAVSVGQVRGMEMQLKGGGVTPYSRRFDGRAVLRSSVREFLAQEAMAALRVPTTRSLCLIATGETIARGWYDDQGRERMMREPGAVGTRVSTSFLRFGQMELFAQNGELDLLRELAEHALEREFPHLRESESRFAAQLLLMFEEICSRQASLVAEWMRVGYCQGNMNSDNAALGGVTLDYGPFAFMEKFKPFYNPWVGGGKAYSYGNQASAATKNLVGLANAFAALVLSLSEDERGMDQAAVVSSLRSSLSSGFGDVYNGKHSDNCRAKLGLLTWDEEAQQLWDDMQTLMGSRSGQAQPGGGPSAIPGLPRMPWNVDESSTAAAADAGGLDFTLFFRSLSSTSLDEDASAAKSAFLLHVLGTSALDPVDTWPRDHVGEWAKWAARYRKRLEAEARPAADRLAEMAAANPKYILRNWMAAEAYEAAERGDYALVQELHGVLQAPYEEQSEETAARWAQPTPRWARERAGLAFMS